MLETLDEFRAAILDRIAVRSIGASFVEAEHFYRTRYTLAPTADR
jgi:CRISPR/Cas system-associated endonuclease Cas1